MPGYKEGVEDTSAMISLQENILSSLSLPADDTGMFVTRNKRRTNLTCSEV